MTGATVPVPLVDWKRCPERSQRCKHLCAFHPGADVGLVEHDVPDAVCVVAARDVPGSKSPSRCRGTQIDRQAPDREVEVLSPDLHPVDGRHILLADDVRDRKHRDAPRGERPRRRPHADRLRDRRGPARRDARHGQPSRDDDRRRHDHHDTANHAKQSAEGQVAALTAIPGGLRGNAARARVGT